MKNFRKTVAIFAAAALIMPAFNGCRKGEEDPFISVKSRNSRLERAWTLKAYDKTVTNTPGGADTWKYDGNLMTRTPSGVPATSKSYTLDLTFTDDNKVAAKETDDGKLKESKDYWNWADADADKVRLNVGASTNYGSGNWYVLRLSSSEMILTRETSWTSTNTSGSVSYKTTEKATFNSK